MSNNKQQPRPENPNNQFSNTEPLTHAQRVAIANTMSNNKQSMKLYTQEQVIEVFEKYGNMSAINARNILDLSESIELPSDSLCINCDESKSTHNVCIDCMIKIGKENIELPSDDEIEAHVEDDFINAIEIHKYSEEAQLLMKAMCKAGALWMRNKIQGGNNE